MKIKITSLFSVFVFLGIVFESNGQVDNTFTGQNSGVNNTGNYNNGYGINALSNNSSDSNNAFGIG